MPASITVSPFKTALEKFKRRKVSNGTYALTSAQWNVVPLEMRERAIFTACVNNAEILSKIRQKIAADLAAGKHDAGNFVVEMKSILEKHGYPTDKDSNSLKDISSGRRLRLIYDMNVEEAHAYGDFLKGQNETILNLFPAYEFKRVEERINKRENWVERFVAAGGKVMPDGKMIALKTALPIWRKLSRFGRPWAPFDFNSGMGLREVTRRDAVKYGLIDKKEKLTPQVESFNKDLKSEYTYDFLHPEVVYDRSDGAVTIGRDGRLELIPAVRANPDLTNNLWQINSTVPTDKSLLEDLKTKATNLRSVSEEHIFEAIDTLQSTLSYNGIGFNLLVGKLRKNVQGIHIPNLNTIILSEDIKNASEAFTVIAHEFGHHIEKELQRTSILKVISQTSYSDLITLKEAGSISEEKLKKHDLKPNEKIANAFEAFCVYETRDRKIINFYRKNSLYGGYKAKDLKKIRDIIANFMKGKKWIL